MNSKMIVMIASALMAGGIMAAELPAFPRNLMMPPSTNDANYAEKMQKMKERRERFMKTQGGYVVKPNSATGSIKIIDTQDVVAGTNFNPVVEELIFLTHLTVEYVKSAKGEPEALKKANNATFAVIVVDDDTTPAALIAPEDDWAIMNVRKVARNLKTDNAREKFLGTRANKELGRILAMLCGGGRSQYQGNIINVNKLEDLDAVRDGLPVDKVQSMKNYLFERGVKPEYRATYRKACLEGWAPEPKNQYQKDIWAAVKSEKEKGPAQPIKILPPKK